MADKILLEHLKNYFGSTKEERNINYLQVSESNRKVAERYIETIDNTKPLSVNTITYNVYIMSFVLRNISVDFGDMTVDDIEDLTRAVNNWNREDDQPVAASTKKQYLIGFKRFLSWYGKRYDKRSKCRDLADLIETKGIKTKQKQTGDMLTDIEIKQMVAAANSKRDKAMIMTFAECGCRLGEILSCFVKDVVNMDDDICKLSFPKGKTGSRTVILYKAKPYIMEYLRHEHPDPTNGDAPLWAVKQFKGYKALAYPSVYGVIKKAVIKAGIKKRVHPHLFRHTCATRLIHEGLSEPRVKNMLGWTAGSNMTSVYVHLDDKDLVAAVKELNGLADKKLDSKGNKVGKCPKCWQSLTETATYCGNCGEPISEEAKTITAKAKSEMEQTIIEKWLESTPFMSALEAFLEKPETQAKMREYSNQ